MSIVRRNSIKRDAEQTTKSINVEMNIQEDTAVDIEETPLFASGIKLLGLEHFKKDFGVNNKFIKEKASIAINGISLTIAEIKNNLFIISIIDHTYKNTNIQFLHKGNYVNIEFDYLARFILSNDKL